MKITEYRAYEILCWLDDQAGDHTNLFEQMTLYRDAAALIRQLQAAEQSAWHAGLDAGREQGKGKDHTHQPAAVDEAMVERALAAYLRRQDDGESLYGCVTAALTAALAQQPAAPPFVCTGDEIRCHDGNGCECAMQGKQPAAVDGAMVERAAIAVFAADSGSVESWPNATEREREFCRRIARAALAAQTEDSDNDR